MAAQYRRARREGNVYLQHLDVAEYRKRGGTEMCISEHTLRYPAQPLTLRRSRPCRAVTSLGQTEPLPAAAPPRRQLRFREIAFRALPGASSRIFGSADLSEDVVTLCVYRETQNVAQMRRAAGSFCDFFVSRIVPASSPHPPTRRFYLFTDAVSPGR